MKVKIEYFAQLREAAGVATETVLVDAPMTPYEVLRRVALARGGRFSSLLLGGSSGVWSAGLMVALDDVQVLATEPTLVHDGAIITVFLAVSGG